MVNSLYGRFGMNEPEVHSFFMNINEFDYRYNSNKYIISSIIDINTIRFLTVLLDNRVIRDFNLKTKTSKNVGIAAAISSKARIKLYRAHESVRLNGGRVLYSDTDSVFAAYKKNVINENHGEIF
jgi:serine/threonine-protein kinase RIO1